ncbi:MAG: hypothetical protein LC789_05755 [Actinobacteria bacterium]|nr:hypothetical protein [Actinomycetota bacterium]MCA1721473.1 hypothetical protein [Actinomycetota bacterium]
MRTDYQGVRTLRIARPLEAPKAWVSAGILTAVLAGLAGGSHEAAARPPVAAPQGRVLAVDLVAPQPIALTFAKPVAPTKAVAVRNVVPARVARVRRPRPVAVAAPSGDCSGAGWQQRRGEAALADLRHPVPAGVTVQFLPGRGSLKGLTYYDRHAVDVFVGSCAAESDALLRHVVAHEMGHAWDSLHMTSDLRAAYLDARGIPAGTPWFGCSYCKDFATPAGDFAETYAQWQRGSSESRSSVAPAATPSQLAELGFRFFS